MRYRHFVLVHIDIGRQFRSAVAPGSGPCVNLAPYNVSLADCQNFHTVTGGQDQHLIELCFFAGLFQRTARLGMEGNGPAFTGTVGGQGKSFPDLNASSAVNETDKVNATPGLFSSSSAKKDRKKRSSGKSGGDANSPIGPVSGHRITVPHDTGISCGAPISASTIMWFADVCPRNSESMAISYAVKCIRRASPSVA